ncbi:MAG: hypothetical protein GF416_06000 [Candidatus Altiarchaeales archaeon]|nr:hypothetical protein [Candidatus Altiarchaeales archaeon]MBD3416668.1 hypothetical protein [Candidatus Altiarchaeales archaeon]
MDFDSIIGRALPYVAIAVLLLALSYAYLSGPSLKFEALALGFGVVAGIVSAYYIYLSISQEKTLELHEEEEIILRSASPSSHFVIVSIGEKDFPFSPTKAIIYLTNLGLMAETSNSGEASLFIPLDRISEFAIHQNGLRVRYMDVNLQFAEVMLYVDNPVAWLEKLAEVLNERAANL